MSAEVSSTPSFLTRTLGLETKDETVESKKKLAKILLITGLALLALSTLAAVCVFSFGGGLALATTAAASFTKAATTIVLTAAGKAALSLIAIILGSGLLAITGGVLSRT